MTFYLIGIAAALVALTIVVRLIEPRMVFFPHAGVQDTPADLGLAYREVALHTADGETVYAWELEHDAAPATVVFWHGNGGNLSVWLDVVAGIHRQGYTVVALDYRGYGKSTGRPSERGLYRDTDALLEHVRKMSRARSQKIVYWGRSLGGPVAAYATTVLKPDALILESTFPDISALIRGNPVLMLLHLFSSYRFPAGEFLRGFDRPVLVMHGDRDRVIPFANGRALFAQLGGTKQFVTIAGADHNDLADPNDDRYWTPIREFISVDAPRSRGPSGPHD